MLKRTLIILASVSILGAGYLTYDKWMKNANISVWSFVPENAIFIYENSRADLTWTELSEINTWKMLELIPEVERINGALLALDSSLNADRKSLELIGKSPFLISSHLTARNVFDFLFVLEIKSIDQQNILKRLQDAYIEGGYTKKVRSYLNFTISEVSNPKGTTFTYIFYRNFFIASSTAYLVEDAIRTLSEKTMRSYRELYPSLFELAKLERDHGNIYLNINQFGNFSRAFYTDPTSTEIATDGFLDMSFQDNSIQFDGFVFASGDYFIHQFSGVDGSAFNLAEIISNDNGVLYHYSCTNPEILGTNLSGYFSGHSDLVSKKQQLISDYDFDPGHVFNLLDEEMALGVQFTGINKNKTLYLRVKDAEDAMDFFRSATERLARAGGDTVFTEAYKNSIIYKLDIREFPFTLLGDHAKGFDECYFTSHRNFIIFSNTLPGIKKQLDDIALENTWRKSLRKVKFLEKTSQESSFSLFLHTPAVWNHMYTKLDEKWKRIASQNDYILKRFENIALQFNEVDNKYYTNIIIDLPESNTTGGLTLKKEKSIELGNPLVTKPFLVRNHNDGLFETLVQDSSNYLYLIDRDFEVAWDLDLNERIIHNVSQIDYYRNNKLQYVFITGSQVHIIDRNGDYLPEYPREISNAKALRYLTIIDYDGSKNYRFGIADEDGNVFITDKDANPLEGWSPRQFGAPLSAPPRHFRIGGTDVIPVQLNTGEIHLMSRRSREYPGFPIKTNQPVSSDYNLRPGSQFATTAYTTITENGQILSVNLKSNTLRREQLFRPNPETHFEIINDVSKSSHIILRKSANEYEVLDSDGSQYFRKDYLQEQEFFVQYYDLSSSKKYIVIGNPQDNFIYLYDLNGKLVTSRPIRGNKPISMLYSGNKDEHQIYIVNQNELALFLMN